MNNPALTSENSVQTPLGTIYAVPVFGKEYPGIHVYLLQEGKSPILLTVVEYNNNSFSSEDPHVTVFSYELEQDEPRYEDYIYQEDIDKYYKSIQ